MCPLNGDGVEALSRIQITHGCSTMMPGGKKNKSQLGLSSKQSKQ
jgi:hypothetical protein